jgi:DNA-binding protein HU-beta
MARKRNTDFTSFLRSQGLRKRVARALSDLESGGRDARGNAEKLARRVAKDLRTAAEEIEKRLNVGGSGSRRTAAKKAARTRKRAATKRSSAAKKGATKRARKSTGRKTASSARKTTGRKTTGRKTTARKRSAKKR